MLRCDVLVVGGGPGGSSVARGLVARGRRVVVLDRQTFPRDKVCAGWVTPQVFECLELDPADYAKDHVLQPVHGFAVSRRGDPVAAASFDGVVSYGIRRCELDHHLLARSGADLRLGEPLDDLRREGGRWVANGEIEAGVVVGAGGHFCPVARRLGATPGPREPTVVAREIEFRLSPDQQERCAVGALLPELYFEPDLRGYGWVVRKGEWLNVGLGRQDTHGLGAHVEDFLRFLGDSGRVAFEIPRAFKGHAYLLNDQSPRPLQGDHVLLVGDAAGMAYGRSGEGIRPAVESGLLAARVLAADVPFAEAARRYAAGVQQRLGLRHGEVRSGASDWIPKRIRGAVVGRLLGNRRFARDVVVSRWFLHRDQPALAPART